jgi:excisionase family DNA binding protein
VNHGKRDLDEPEGLQVATSLLTTREVADRLGLAPATVLRWAQAGKLPAVYLSSRAVRFRAEDLATFLEERATPRRGTPSPTPNAAQPVRLLSEEPSPTDDEEHTDAR